MISVGCGMFFAAKWQSNALDDMIRTNVWESPQSVRPLISLVVISDNGKLAAMQGRKVTDPCQWMAGLPKVR